MFSGVDASSIIANATTFASSLETPVLIVAGLGVAFMVGNWIAAKFAKRR
jgi:hypothetical protein